MLKLRPREIRRAAQLIRHFREDGRADDDTGKSSHQSDTEFSGNKWKLTSSLRPTACHLVIAQPPFGARGEIWCNDELRAFTEVWCGRWATSGARHIAVLWRLQWLFSGRSWLDESLAGYRFQQLLGWHAPGAKAADATDEFVSSWHPILLYRMVGVRRNKRLPAKVKLENATLDLHVAKDFAAADWAEEPARAPRSVIDWLIDHLSQEGERVASLYCGTAVCGKVCLESGRQFYGVEPDRHWLEAGRSRLSN
jgi:hypothetical protein